MIEDRDSVFDDICKRLSLRPPQAESLKRLAAAIEAADCRKGVDEAGLEEQLAAVRALFPVERYPEVDLPHASKFDWDFLSFCFALATGVGKTRLMGAIIAYLYRVKGYRNFVVIAPGKTVYEKLISDFTEGSPKYVFRGLSCFATKKPVVVTGDTYQSGAGLLDERDLLGHSIAINIFNIQKLNERGDTHDDAQKEVAKIRRLNERIGQSYFDYLKGRDDLVVLMDEAHHYRASAAAETIAALQPVLGIEMTATPRVGNRPFRNVLCEYGLAKAMSDGFVKEPAVVRRQNFRKDDYTNRADDLDRQKLTDAMVVHEATKSALAEYAFKNGKTKVKPFVLVVAPDTKYAGEVEEYLKSTDFYGGKYAEKVVKVDYKARGSNDEAIAQLLDIERPGNKIEIVIHVNMLSEGWDVTNLYTIVPLRAANSANLVEQTIGRGLRLPYGVRTGVMELDTLSIVSHDRFDEIIAAARNMQITIRERMVPSSEKEVLTVAPKILEKTVLGRAEDGVSAAVKAIGEMIADDTSGRGVDISSPEMRKRIEESVAKVVSDSGGEVDMEAVSNSVGTALRLIGESMIDIPRIAISPGTTAMRISEFTLDLEKVKYTLRDDRLVYDFVTDRRVRDVKAKAKHKELENSDIARFIKELIADVANSNDIDYDYAGNRSVIAGLCDTCIRGLAAKLPPDEMFNCMRNNRRTLAESIKQQILEHACYDSDDDVVIIQPGPILLKANALSVDAGEKPRPYDVALAGGEKSRIRSMVFAGFRKCLFSLQKFDSDPERAFSEMLEREGSVQKWFKPTLSNLRLWYGSNEYTPDFVVETDTEKLLCEVKALGQVDDAVVQSKKEAALKWCHYANESGGASGVKRWRYLLVPDSAINSSLTLAEAVKSYG
jgi:type III restriction enzyme